MKKRLLPLLIALVMVFGLVAACGQQEGPIDETTPVPTQEPAAPEDPVEEPADEESADEPQQSILTVGYAANMNGDFIEGFGNNAYDLTIKTLLHHFASTYVVNRDDESPMINGTYVSNVDTEDDADGNRTYTFTLQDGLTWSDGSQITAEDYVTTLLFQASPQWVVAGAASGTGDGLLGYAAYNSGETDTFAGVKLLGELEFSLTIDANELPYFHEFALVSYGPICKATYVPDIAIVSDENGAKFDGDISADCERIANTERFAPTVVSGPYTFVSFENQIATLALNPNFPGDSEGKKPTIETIVQMSIPEETEVDMLIAGQVDLLPASIEGDKINRVMAEPHLKTSSHLRNGYGVMNMINDWGPTADQNVRWAIACLVDRNQIIEQVTGGYGSLIDGAFGQAQWMFQELRAEIQATLIPINLSIERANEYLDASEWRFEEDGTTPFDASKATADGTYMRHNSDGEMLVINHAAAAASVGNVLEIEFAKNTPLAGMQYNFFTPEFDVILNEYYLGMTLDPSERTYNTFSMGLGFSTPFDPYYSYHTDWIVPYYNCAGISDELLDEYIVAMRRTEAGDRETYLEHWFNFQVRFNEILPQLPLYANEYVNLFNGKLSDVPTTSFADWYDVISDIHIVG